MRVAVIDDASTDQTPEMRAEFKTVSWERWNERQGHVLARNRMMLTATEDYYASLDDDSWFMQGDEIAVALEYLERNKNVAAVAYDILSPDRPHAVSRGARRSVAVFIGCGHVVRLSAVKELGGYASFPRAYGAEEKDLCLRLIDSGYQIVKLDGVHVWHDKSSLARDVPRQHCSVVCNDLALTLRRVPLSLLVPILTWKVLSHLMFALRSGLLRPCLEGIRDFAFAAGDLWGERSAVKLSTIAHYRTLTRFSHEIVNDDLDVRRL